MIRSFIEPKNTLTSVATEIKLGLNKKSIYLNDKQLLDAGYEIHEQKDDWPFFRRPVWSTIYGAASIALIIQFFTTDIPNRYLLINSLFVALLLLEKLIPRRKRVITKKSSRR